MLLADHLGEALGAVAAVERGGFGHRFESILGPWRTTRDSPSGSAEVLATRDEIAERRIFGSLGFFVGGNMAVARTPTA